MIRQSDSEPSTATDLHLLLTQLTELRRAMEQSVEFDDGLDRSLCTALHSRMRDCASQLARVIGRLEHNLLQRESIESALHESEHRYRLLYDNNPSMYFTLSPDGLILSVNNYGAEQLGYLPQELIGRSVLAVFRPEDHETVLSQIRVCTAGLDELFEWEIQKIRKDGTTLWVKERAQGIRDRAGRILVLVVCEDVTARRMTEDIVRESEARWKTLFEHAGVGIAQLSLSGQYLCVNPCLYETLGFSSKTMLPFTLQELTHPDDLAFSLRCLQDLTAGIIPSFSIEQRCRRYDGMWIWVDLTVSLVRAASGTPAYFIAVIQSIHDRKQAEDSLRRTTHLVQTLVQASPLPIVSLDLEARVTTWNQAATKLFGWTEEEVLGREIPYVPEDEAAAADVLWQQGLHGEIRGPIKLRRRRKDGAILDLLLWPVIARSDDDTVSTVIGLYVDQSDLKRAQAAQLKSELRLRSFLDALDDLAFEFDQNGTYVNVWTRNEENLLVPRHEIIGKRLHDIFCAEDSARYLDAIHRVLTIGRPELIEYAIAINGQLRHFSAIMSRIPVVAEAPATVACVVRDITNQKQAEEALRESEQAIRSLYEAASNPGLNLDQQIQTVLELGCRRFRLPIGIVTGLRGEQLELTHVWAPGTSFTPGMRLPLCQTYCSTTLKSKGVTCVEHARASEWRDHPGYKTLGLECYIGTNVHGQSEVHGTICFLGPEPRPTPFNEADKDFLLLMAQWIAAESDRRQAERRLERINECFLAFGSDPLANIHRLTALCGEILGGTCALYSRLKGEFLCAVGQWHQPANFQALDKAEGHLCTNLIRSGADHLVTVRHLPNTSYAKTDPNVGLYQLQTYIGKVVSIENDAVGSLCVVFQRDFIPTEADERLMGILASAIGTEEQRIRAQEALRTSELRLQQFVSEAPVGLVILDSQRRLLAANKAFCTLTGYVEQELLGRTYDLYTHPDDLPINLKLTDEYYRGLRTGYTIEKRYIRKTGQVIWVSVNATGVELPNHPGPLLLAAVQDITDQKRATEERERLSQDLHDNILQSLYAVGMQLEASTLAADKSVRKARSHANHAIAQLNRLVGDVRDFIALLKRDASPRMNLRQALQQLVSAFSAAGRRPPELDIKDGVLDLMTPDRAEQLLNIAREALSNSVRHAKASHQSVRLWRIGQTEVRMQICDDGIGFNPTVKRKQGHGLRNMAARAKKIGARLRLTSKPNRGTCVTIDLPTEDSHEHETI